MRALRLVTVLAFLAAVPALAHSFQLGAIEIGHPWAPPGGSGEAMVYLALSNRGAAADRLVSASSPLARDVDLRGGDGAPLREIVLAPKHPLALRAGRPHIVLHDLAHPLAAGEEFPLTLTFAAAGSVEVTVMVETAPGG